MDPIRRFMKASMDRGWDGSMSAQDDQEISAKWMASSSCQSSPAKVGHFHDCVTEYHQSISSAPLAPGWRGYFVALWRVSRGNKSQTFRQLSNGVAMDLSG